MSIDSDHIISRRQVLAAMLLQPVIALVSDAKTLAQESFTPSTYPDPRVETIDKRFTYKIGNASVEKIATGFRWAEGPVYFPDLRCLIWSDIPNNRMMRWLEDDGHLSVYRNPSNYSNGNTRDKQGRLVSCEHLTRRVTRTEYDGKITVLADKYDGKPFNAPNDIIVDSKGAIWFTDPGYGIESPYEGDLRKEELPRNVYRLDPATGKLKVVVDDLTRPNGLALSPDETILYVVDSTEDRKASIRMYDVRGDSLHNSRMFADNFNSGSADGVKVDDKGNVWCSMGWTDANENGVRCYTPHGDLIGKIHLPEICANLCFGGKDNSRLFMAASTSIYSVYLNDRGL